MAHTHKSKYHISISIFIHIIILLVTYNYNLQQKTNITVKKIKISAIKPTKNIPNNEKIKKPDPEHKDTAAANTVETKNHKIENANLFAPQKISDDQPREIKKENLYSDNIKEDSSNKPHALNVDIDGWDLDFIPNLTDETSESGKITFEITIDNDGFVIQIITIEKNISNTLESYYRDVVASMTFVKQDSNSKEQLKTSGKITFIIKAI